MPKMLLNASWDLSKSVRSVKHTDESWFTSERFYILS